MTAITFYSASMHVLAVLLYCIASVDFSVDFFVFSLFLYVCVFEFWNFEFCFRALLFVFLRNSIILHFQPALGLT